MRATLIPSLASAIALALTSCAPEGTTAAVQEGTSDTSAEAPTMEPASLPIEIELNTFISDWIQVDHDPDCCPGDANLYTGDDPADGTASYDTPEGGDTYIDWEDLAATITDHQYIDVPVDGGKDPSAFPRSNSCVGEANVLSKMDLTYVGAANNTEYAWFVVQRSSNNGDAGYYWLITREAPTLDDVTSECRPAEALLTFDLKGPDAATGSVGDLLLLGHFHSSGTQLRVFQANADFDGLTAVEAMAYSDTTIWTEVYDGFAVAVNTTPTRAGTWGDFGVRASDGVDLESEIVAEAAVDLSLISGDAICGGAYYGTVLTRSSGSGELSPDLKDLAGPMKLNMQVLTPHASLSPTCNGTIVYDGWIDEDLDVTCDWVFDDGTTTYEVLDSCEGEVALPPGDWSAELTVTALDSGCSDTFNHDAVSLGEVLTVDGWLTATCELEFEYDAIVDGNSGITTVRWIFEDAEGEVGGSSDLSGAQAVGSAGTYAGTVIVEDDRGDGLVCSASDAETVDLLEPLGVAPDLTGTCANSFGYAANVTGGTAGHSVSWTFSDGSTSTSESGSVSVGAQPTGGGTYSGEVEVLDVRPDGLECTTSGSDETVVYSPVEVSIAAGASGITCDAVEDSDAVTWTPEITGGTGDFSYDWTVDSCDGNTTCTVDPPDDEQCYDATVQLTVGDGGICDDATSESEGYTKYTVVEISAL